MDEDPRMEGWEDTLEEIPDPAGCDLEAIWNQEWEENLRDAALQKVKRQVKPKQFQMFFLHVIKELSVAEVAERVGASVTQVYLAKHRVGGLFKQCVTALKEGED